MENKELLEKIESKLEINEDANADSIVNSILKVINSFKDESLNKKLMKKYIEDNYSSAGLKIFKSYIDEVEEMLHQGSRLK